MKWFNKYVPVFMCVGRKPHPFSNYRNTIWCSLSSIFFKVQIVEVKDLPQQIGQNECYESGKMVNLMLRICRAIFGRGKAVVLDIGYSVAKVITDPEAKGVYEGYLTKKRHYWLK